MLTPIANAVAYVFGSRQDRRFQYETADRNDPLAWLYRLENRLEHERLGRAIMYPDGSYEWRLGLGMLDAYYDGNHPLPEVVDNETRERYLEFMRRSRSNYMRVVVDAERERVHWNGIRVGSGDDAEVDMATWDILQENGVDLAMPLAVKTALIKRRSYWSVWYPSKGEKVPQVRVEDPAQVIVEYAPGDRRRRVAGLKVWIDEWDGTKLANLFLPGQVHRFYWHPGDRLRPSGWYEREPMIRHGLGIPLIPMVNRPTLHLDPDGWSELDGLTPIQDRINQTDLNRQVAEHFSAFPQKWATGIHIPTDENGEPIKSFAASIDSFWTNSNPDGRWGQFEATRLDNYTLAKQADIQDVAILSATPRHYFTVNGQAPSGDSMKSAEAGLIAKVNTFESETAGPAVSEVVSLVREIQGDSVAPVSPIWGDPEYRTFSQLVDGTSKLVETKLISRRHGRELIGMTPSVAQRMEDEIREEMREMAKLQEELAPEPDPAQQVVDTDEPVSK